MKRLFQLLALSFLALSSQAQTTTATKTVTKTVSGNALTEDLTVPTGRTLTVATGGTATAPAWFLNTFTASTINTGQNGLGWDENGRVTLQTPVGALQFYQTGSPLESVIYWPGRIITSGIGAGTITGTLPASSITAPMGTESINSGIIARSLGSPLSEWLGRQDYAGANGIPYVTDAQGTNGSLEATDGVYFPQAVVSGQSTVTSGYAGRYRTATQVKADLAITTADVSGLGSAATTASSAYDPAGSSATAQAAAIAASQPRATTRVVTASGALTAADAVIVCTGAGGITLTLPAANAATPRPVQLEIINRTSGNVTLSRAGSDLFEGYTTALITTGASWSITSDASANWYLY
jgi:hypothetical protein